MRTRDANIIAVENNSLEMFYECLLTPPRAIITHKKIQSYSIPATHAVGSGETVGLLSGPTSRTHIVYIYRIQQKNKFDICLRFSVP